MFILEICPLYKHGNCCTAMKVLTLYQGNAYFNFIESLHSESTKRNYAYGLKHFLTHHQLKDPEEILSIPLDSLEEMIKKYVVFLTTVHKSSGMARVNLAALRHFCKMNKIKLDWDLITAFKGKGRIKGKDKAYDHEDIHKLLSVCSIRLKVIVLIYASTGIRSAALPPLKLKHITKIDNIYKFNIYDDDNEAYYSLCTPECANAIDKYLEYRQRYGEKLTPESPLIREDFSTAGNIRQKPRHITSSTITTILIDKLNKIGIREVDHVKGCRSRKSVKIIHGFRKFFETQLLQSDVNYVVTKMLMDHDLKLEENYFRPTQEYIIKEYSKAIDLLTIDPSQRLKRQLVHEKEKNTETSKILARLAKLEADIGIKI